MNEKQPNIIKPTAWTKTCHMSYQMAYEIEFNKLSSELQGRVLAVKGKPDTYDRDVDDFVKRVIQRAEATEGADLSNKTEGN